MDVFNKVVIPAAGLGQRLGDETSYLPKLLVRVGNKPVLSFLIEKYLKYNKDITFIILVGYKKELITQFINLIYPNLNIILKDVDDYSSPKSGLPYSLSHAESFLQEPFIFNTCDTIANHAIEFCNSVVVCDSSNISNYSTASYTPEKKLLQLQDKGMDGLAYTGISTIINFHSYWESSKILKPTQKSDIHIINNMLKQGESFSIIPASLWHDTGNLDSLKKARNNYTDVQPLHKQGQELYILNHQKQVVKFNHDSSIISKMAYRSKKIQNLLPKNIRNTKNFLSYNWVDGKLATDTIYPTKMYKLLKDCQKHLWTNQIENHHELTYKFYVTKTLNRLRDFSKITGIQDVEFIVNDVATPSASSMIIKLSDYLSCGIMVPAFHGDLHFSNILVHNNTFTLLDWREDFGGCTEYGDIYYDLAKLNHGLLVSHDLIKNNQFTINIKQGTVDIVCHERLIECQDILKKFCEIEGFSWSRVKILTALIYLNIAALHHDPYNKFLYYFGKYLLTKYLKEIEDEITPKETNNHI